jgi:hypothetical protein
MVSSEAIVAAVVVVVIGTVSLDRPSFDRPSFDRSAAVEAATIAESSAVAETVIETAVAVDVIAEPVDPPIYYEPPEIPLDVDVPRALRQKNWGRRGSCCYAAAVTGLSQHGWLETGKWIRRNFSGAAGVKEIAAIYDRCGIKYKITYDGDADLLEFADEHRHTATIHFYRKHAVTFCGYETRGGREYAVLIDSNTDRLDWIRKENFLRRWNGFGGYAIVPLLTPNPPRPYNVFNHVVTR